MGGAPSKHPQMSHNEKLLRITEGPFVASVLPMTVVHVFHTYDIDILSSQDIDTVKATTQSKGDREGAIELLHRLHRYPNWFPCLQKVLRDPQVNQSHLADALKQLVECADGNMSVPRADESVDRATATDRLFKTDINLLLIGKTGAGKSATGNSILLKDAFKSTSSTTSVTNDINYDYSEHENVRIKIVDTPGVADTKMSLIQNRSHLAAIMARAIMATPGGYHAFLLVVPFGRRFTKEDDDSIKILKCIFGSRFIKDHAILLLTYGDQFSGDTSALHRWCQDQKDTFNQLYEECDGRVMIFDNKTESEENRGKQVEDLLEMVKTQFYCKRRYDSRIFSVASTYFSWILRGQTKNEEIVRELGIITGHLTCADVSEHVSASQRMEKVMQLRKATEDNEADMQKVVDEVWALALKRDIAVKEFKEKEREIWDQWKNEEQQFEEQWKKNSDAADVVSHSRLLVEKTDELRRKRDEGIENLRKKCKEQLCRDNVGLLGSYEHFKKTQLRTHSVQFAVGTLANILRSVLDMYFL